MLKSMQPIKAPEIIYMMSLQDEYGCLVELFIFTMVVNMQGGKCQGGECLGG